MTKIADFIDAVLNAPEDNDNLMHVKNDVIELCKDFPLYT
jgi:glycine/serine hydroxymethyltransferase